MRFILAALFVPLALPAQVRTVSLSAPNARLSVEFSDLTVMRELPDGRVLLFDRREGRFGVADFATGSFKDITRIGQGPGEFQFVGALLPLGGDSSLAADISRWLILDGDKVVATLPPDTPAIRATQLWPLGADRQGHVLSRAIRRGGRLTDSVDITLVNRASGQADTIATLRSGVRRAPASRVTNPEGGTGLRVGRVPLNVQETPILFADGWTAVARLEPYRVDWRFPDGRWTLGRPIPVPDIRMDDRERKAYAERHPGFRNATDWPETLPPFDTPTSLLATPDGWLLIRRLPSTAEPETRYDVIDRSGVRRAQLVLASNEHILGFGASSVYVIQTDSDGIQWLRRHTYSAAAVRP